MTAHLTIARRALPFVAGAGILALAMSRAHDHASASQEAAGGLVFTQVPAGSAPSLESASDLRDPHPAGSRVCAIDPDVAGAVPRVLSEGFFAAGSPAVAPDGDGLLFCGKQGPDDSWGIWESDLRGGKVRRITPPAFNAMHPDWLAGDRVVFSADAPGTADPRDGGASFSLYTCERDGSALERITFNPGSDVDPTVLRDGRILYSAWQPPGPDRPEGCWALFTVRRDGTGILPFYGSHDAPVDERRPRELDDGRIAFTAATDPGDAPLRTVALRRPLHSLSPLELPGFRSPLSVSSWDADGLLLSLVPVADAAGSGTAGLWVTRPSDPSPHLVFDDPSMDEVDAVRARLRARPRGLVSDTNPESETGTLLCLDACRTDRHGLPEMRLPAVAVRIYQADPAGLQPAGASAVPSQQLVEEIRLAPDGSFLTDVPADVPLRFETIDASGDVLLDSGGWVWVRPGEQRSCIGCHEDRESAPPNALPQVLSPDHEPAPEPAPQIVLGGTR